MEIIQLRRDMRNLEACLKQAGSVFFGSALRFRPELEKYAAILRSDIESELRKAVENPGENAVFAGIEERGGRKNVVAISHVMFGGKIPEGWILIRWIGTAEFVPRYGHGDKRDLLVRILAERQLKEKGYGDRMLEHILRSYGKGGYRHAYAECPQESKTAISFSKDTGSREQAPAKQA